MIEQVILSNLIENEKYSRKVISYLDPSYFTDKSERILFEIIRDFINKYNERPSKTAIQVQLEATTLDEQTYQVASSVLLSLNDNPTEEYQWLLDQTEKFCQDKAIYNGIVTSLDILNDKDNGQAKGTIPKILSDALAVSFDTHIGHDFLKDVDTRFEFYNRIERRIPFDIDLLNKITSGGITRKTLNILLAGTGVGKSLCMCHFAATNLMAGLNVLYITMEMAEERIAERIDANLLDIPIHSLKKLSQDEYKKKVDKIRGKTVGKLIIKEYPTAAAHTGHFRHLLNELRIKRQFIPDVLYVDYLNICASARVKLRGTDSYSYVKAIAEELRGLAIEFNIPIWSATQLNRQGFTDSDPGLEHTSESFGLPATADLMLAVVSNDELEKLNQFMISQLKNRYNDPTYYKRFVIGVDRSRMRLYDVESSAQTLIQPDAVVIPNNTDKFDTSMFADFK